ncbi:hypothetical protein V6N12_057635 [Hibiscus sabdariffa]|uniref:Uncharacterized protein n=1 Tax=Hibiscus sabdariffa TaxID=183260 RepID=A0ABR2C799_9ROSI
MAISEQTESMELATPQEQNQQAEFNQLDDHMYGAGTRESPVGGLSTHQEEVPEAINIRCARDTRNNALQELDQIQCVPEIGYEPSHASTSTSAPFYIEFTAYFVAPREWGS